MYYQFQLQDNLSQVIKKLDKVDDAVVNISLAQESAFELSENEMPASASVLLKLKDNPVHQPGRGSRYRGARCEKRVGAQRG